MRFIFDKTVHRKSACMYRDLYSNIGKERARTPVKIYMYISYKTCFSSVLHLYINVSKIVDEEGDATCPLDSPKSTLDVCTHELMMLLSLSSCTVQYM